MGCRGPREVIALPEKTLVWGGSAGSRSRISDSKARYCFCIEESKLTSNSSHVKADRLSILPTEACTLPTEACTLLGTQPAGSAPEPRSPWPQRSTVKGCWGPRRASMLSNNAFRAHSFFLPEFICMVNTNDISQETALKKKKSLLPIIGYSAPHPTLPTPLPAVCAQV